MASSRRMRFVADKPRFTDRHSGATLSDRRTGLRRAVFSLVLLAISLIPTIALALDSSQPLIDSGPCKEIFKKIKTNLQNEENAHAYKDNPSERIFLEQAIWNHLCERRPLTDGDRPTLRASAIAMALDPSTPGKPA